MPLPLTVFCFSKIRIGSTFLVPAHPGGPGQRAVKRVCVCVCVCSSSSSSSSIAIIMIIIIYGVSGRVQERGYRRVRYSVHRQPLRTRSAASETSWNPRFA